MADRQNGNRRMYALDEEGTLSKVNLFTHALDMHEPFIPRRVVQVGDFDVNLTVCLGVSDERFDTKWDTLLLCQQGDIMVSTDRGDVRLNLGDTVVIPKDTPFSVAAENRALLLEFVRATE
jgi:homogentisate 1,2-dioxygenase